MFKKKQEDYVIFPSMDYNEYSKNQIIYFTDRILDQIKWYDAKAKYNQKRYKTLSIFSFCVSSVIPILALLGQNIWIKCLIAAAGSIVSITTYILNINSYKDLWVQYRMNCEMLKSELMKFNTNTAPYDKTETSFNILVNTCEQYFTKEFTKWQSKSSQSSTGS